MMCRFAQASELEVFWVDAEPVGIGKGTRVWERANVESRERMRACERAMTDEVCEPEYCTE